MPRPQFSIRTLLWLTLVVAAFMGGILFEQERVRREREKLANQAVPAYGAGGFLSLQSYQTGETFRAWEAKRQRELSQYPPPSRNESR